MENKPKFRPNPNLKLMDQVQEVLRYHHCAYRTEQTYCQWILRYIHYFGGKTHPRLLGANVFVCAFRMLISVRTSFLSEVAKAAKTGQPSCRKTFMTKCSSM